jgi:polyisoprenoid-binding protein YceI
MRFLERLIFLSMNTNDWNIDPTHSSITFSVRHLVFSKVRGRFGKLRGAIALDEPKVDVTIEAASIDTGVADRDGHLRSPDFLDAERFPEITYASKSVERTKKGYRISGDLTLHGVTRALVLDAEEGGRGKDPWGNERVAFSASASIDRREFGLTWNQVLEAGGVLVGETIEIEIEIQAVKAKAAA